MKKISLRHKLYTKENTKNSLYNFCETRYPQFDGINTYALGHKNTSKKMDKKKLL